MTQRGFREANLKLQSLNERLEERAAELIRANEQLEARNIAVERERATLAAIMASMSDGLIVAGADGQIRYGNERAAELLGLDATALASQSVAEIWARLGFSADDLEAALADAETPPILEAVARSRRRAICSFTPFVCSTWAEPAPGSERCSAM
ncbi:MAG: cell wall metabolism sensor histidine kinase WalK [Actinobacteria bacterium]|nr:MAG: cell wall metabolism sensor histidine kinase WalK [Actinomycetota bacterium]